MDGQPVITYAGDQTSFVATQHLITQLLPREQYEWRRSYGRAARMVRVTARFVPFNVAQLTAAVMSASATMASLTALPFLHIFWVDCDVDTYKLRVRDDLSQWLSQLRALNILDWLVVVIARDDSKVKSKLLRTSVFDKVKGEFAGRYPDRCVQLTAAVGEPTRNDAGSSTAAVAAAAATGEPWPTLLQRIKELLLASYSRQLLRFEEHMRAERECRVDRSWSFNRYFLLQEELATFYDALGLYEDALLQYDELDALLAQLVVSHTTSPGAGPPPAWLQHYCQPAEHWDGALPMDRAVAARRRAAIREDRACLLDLRSYLLGQQCGLLLRLGQPWEAARRALSVTVASVHELRALDVGSIPGSDVANGSSAGAQQPPAGSLACWSLLTCAGALELCEQFKPTSVAALGDEYHSATAGLWKTVQASLYTLGNLCGLLQATPPSSAQLHLVVQLVAGLRDPAADTQATSSAQRAGGRSESQAGSVGGSNGGSDSPRGSAAWCARPAAAPRQRLLSALSSQRSFEEYYLEVIELTMGTFKHIGHPRTAQVLGSQLAHFYLQRKAAQKAEALLLASLATYDRERWSLLSAHSQLALAECQTLVAAGATNTTAAGRGGSGLMATAAAHSLAATHLAVAASERLEMAVRQEHLERFVKLVGGSNSSSSKDIVLPGVSSGHSLSDFPAQFLSARGSLCVMSVVLEPQHHSCSLTNPAIASAGYDNGNGSSGVRNSSDSSGDDRTKSGRCGSSRLLTGCGCALSVTVHSRLPIGLLARAVVLRLRRHRPNSSAPVTVGRPALPLTATSPAAASGGLRLHVEVKAGETGEPAYSIVCSNARSLLARRDSKPPSTSAAAAAAAAAAAGRREPLSARASLDSGFLSVPALAIGESAPPIAAASSMVAVAATAAASAVASAPMSIRSESHSSSCSSSGTLSAAPAAFSADTTTFVGAITFGLEASPDGSRSSRSSSVAGPSATAAAAVATGSAVAHSEELDWTLKTAEPVELRPGLTAVSVHGTVPAIPGTFSPEELLVELNSGATISLHDDSMVRCCCLVTWPARNPSLTIQPAGGSGTLLFGVINRCLVTFDVGDSTRSAGRSVLAAGRCTLSCSGGAVVSHVAWQCVDDVASHASPTSVARDLESTGTPAALQTEIDLWCEPTDFSLACVKASECVLSANWSSADGSLTACASSTVSLRHPFCVSHGLYSTATGKFVQLSLSGTVIEGCSGVVATPLDCSMGAEAATALSRSFDILSVDLLNDVGVSRVLNDDSVGTSRPGIAVRRVVGHSSRDGVVPEMPHRLSPGDQLHYLWMLEPTGADAGAERLGPPSSEPLATEELPTRAQLRLTFRFRTSDCFFSHLPSSDDTSSRVPSSCLGSYTFSTDFRPPLFEVSKALIPSSDYYLTTKECKMAVTVRCLFPLSRGVLLRRGDRSRRPAPGYEPSADGCDTTVQADAASDELTTVYYEIGSSEEWAISGDRRGKVTLQAGSDASAAASAELAVLLVPLVSGCLRLPHVSLLSAESGGRTASLAIGSVPCEADDVAAALPPDSSDEGVQPADSSRCSRDDRDIAPTSSAGSGVASVAAADAVAVRSSSAAASVVRHLNESDVYDRSAALLVRVLAANDDHA